jgi:hypothetical protein
LSTIVALDLVPLESIVPNAPSRIDLINQPNLPFKIFQSKFDGIEHKVQIVTRIAVVLVKDGGALHPVRNVVRATLELHGAAQFVSTPTDDGLCEQIVLEHVLDGQFGGSINLGRVDTASLILDQISDDIKLPKSTRLLVFVEMGNPAYGPNLV